MTDSPFAKPSAGGGQFEPKDWNGHVLLIYAKSYVREAPTKFGVSTAADADILILSAPGPDGRPTFIHRARLFGNLADSVQDSVNDRPVLGKLGQGANTKGNPPWIIIEGTDEERAMWESRATPAHQAYMGGQFKAPNPASAATTPVAPATAYAPPADPWAAMGQPPTQSPSLGPAPAVQDPPAASAPAAGDPNIATLINNGLNPQQVMAMDPATRAAIAVTFQ